MTDARGGWLPAQGRGPLLTQLLLAAASVTAVASTYVNHDAAWYLHMAARWLDGARLYVDVVDTNPPLIVWITAVPVGAARALGLPPPAVFQAFVFAVLVASLLAVARLAREYTPRRTVVIMTSSVFLCLPFVKGDFGQREHLAVALVLPYVLAAAGSPLPRRAGAAVGVAAGLGFMMKPHFLAAWMLVEGALFAGGDRRAWRRPAAVAALCTALAYPLIALATTAAYLPVLQQVRQVYGGLDSEVAVLIRLREGQLWLAALALFAGVRWPAGDRLPAVLFAAGTGFLIAALLQQKGWGYQLYPARVFVLMFLAAGVATLLDQLPSAAALLRGGFRGLGVVLAGALLAASARYVAEARHPAAPDLVTPLVRAIHRHAPHGPVAVLSMRTIIYPAFPAVNYAAAPWRLRHNSLWFLQGFYVDQDLRAGGPLAAHPLDGMPPLERVFFDQIVDDLCAAPPRLLLMERAAANAPAGRRALDLNDYYGQSPRARQLLGAYAAVGELGPFTLFVPHREPGCVEG